MDARPAGVAVGHGLGFDDRTDGRLDELAGLPYASIRYDAAPAVSTTEAVWRTDRATAEDDVVRLLASAAAVPQTG